MEGLRSQAHVTRIKQFDYVASDSDEYAITDINFYPSSSIAYKRMCKRLQVEPTSDDHLFTHLNRPPPRDEHGDEATASFQLVEITARRRTFHFQDEASFQHLLEILKVDPYHIELHADRKSGLYDLSKVSALRGGPNSQCYCVVDRNWGFAWSFDPESATTKAILYGPPRHRLLQAANRLLPRHASMADHPLFLLLVAAFAALSTAHSDWLAHWDDLVEVEKNSGYSPWRYTDEEKPDYAQSSSVVGAASVGLASVRWALEMVAEWVQKLKEEASAHGIRSESQIAFQSSCTEMRAVAELLGNEVASLRRSVDSIQERARTQLNVLFNLIAKEDANVSLTLAEDSRAIAYAAKRDSSSMKTVAIMTIAFLPATFYAALFAMPLFQWASSPVVQDRFWVYCAFTFPTTLTIFVIYLVLEHRDFVKRGLEEQLERAKIKREFRSGTIDDSNVEKREERTRGMHQNMLGKTSGSVFARGLLWPVNRRPAKQMPYATATA